ncbi:hypothetical protein K0M31_004446 [Melipona bicolor]|uniref:Uncharacterized protein n=1 Tax=Melipona bicolor TaxID=60889 RepID=A0AA40FWS9_9HYME|nr:hypothetical protein K0M31_004446 [Melipona bicolor]
MISNGSDREAEQGQKRRAGKCQDVVDGVSPAARPHGAKSIDDDAGHGVEKLGVFSSKVTAALTPPRPRGVGSRSTGNGRAYLGMFSVKDSCSPPSVSQKL